MNNFWYFKILSDTVTKICKGPRFKNTFNALILEVLKNTLNLLFCYVIFVKDYTTFPNMALLNFILLKSHFSTLWYQGELDCFDIFYAPYLKKQKTFISLKREKHA